jgi:hypothetical protein
MKSNSIDGCHHIQLPSPVHSSGHGNGDERPTQFDVINVTLVVKKLEPACKPLRKQRVPPQTIWKGRISPQARRRLRSSSGMRSWRTRACSRATPVR